MSFQDFQQNRYLSKKCLNDLEAKKVDYIFEETPNLYLIVFLVSFFSFLFWSPAENRAKLKKLFNLNTQTATDFLLKNCSNVSGILN